jgi:glycogen operon protein
VRALRERQKRNFLATLLFSQGVPMLVAGDEMGRTQAGNNNAYCQDSALSWLDWELDEDARALMAFTSRLIRLRNEHPLFRRRTYFRGRAVRDPEMKDISWLNPDGAEMSDHDWNKTFARALGVLISGRGLTERDEFARLVEDDDLLLLLNAHDEDIAFTLPAGDWQLLLDTSDQPLQKGEAYRVQARSLALLVKPNRSGRARTDG